MKKKILWLTFLLSTLIIVLIFSACIGIMFSTEEKTIKKQLVNQTLAVAELYSGDFSHLKNISDNSDVRITAMSADGTVLFESDTTVALENHLTRPEVQAAINGAPKIFSRRSASLDEKMLYYAVSGNNGIILRLSVKSTQVSKVFTPSIPYIISSFVLALIISYVLASLLSKYFTKKLDSVSQSLRSLNNGNYKPISTNMNEPELYSIFTEMKAVFKNTERYIKIQQAGQIKLDFILNNVKQGIVAIDSRKKVVQINTPALAFFEHDASIVDKNLIYLIDNPILHEKIINSINNNEDASFDMPMQNKHFSFLLRKLDDSAIADDIAYILLIDDLSEEKLFIQQKSDFFANASHELKTPLTSMQGLSELMLAKGDLSPQNEKYALRISEESKRMNRLILDMLKLSKLEKHAESAISVCVDLKEVCEDVIADIAIQTAQKNITVTLSGEGTIMSDQKNIEELVSNIFSNAISYNVDNGKVDISILKREQTVILTISDTGIGIPKEDIPRLCERFFRVNKSRSKKSGGTGLGLAIVKHICGALGATLDIQSEEGVGTTISVIFNS